MANIFNTIWQKIIPGGAPGGQVLDKNGAATIITTSDEVNKLEPYGTDAPKHVKGRPSGMSQVNNQTFNIKVSDVQSAFRSAERGDTSKLFAMYRDVFSSTGTVVSQLSSRKLAVLSEPYTILPNSDSPDDVLAAKIVEENIKSCRNWPDFLSHMLNSILYPVAVGEKIFRTVSPDESNPLKLRYVLDQVYPVDYSLLNYKLPYLPQGTTGNVLTGAGNPPYYAAQTLMGQSDRPEDLIFDQDSWEPELRLYSVYPNGMINYAWTSLYAADPSRHVVYRSNLLQGIVKDNFGGQGKSVLFWALMENWGRDIFLRLMNKYGMPYVVAKADTSDVNTMAMLEEAFANTVNLNALVVNADASVEIKEVALAGAADAHTKFTDLCRDQMSRLISGQTLSSTAGSTGMGSGVAKLQGDVRSDYIAYDRLSLGAMLETQVFNQLLTINNCRGKSPKIVWGSSIEDGAGLSSTLASLDGAGLTPTDDAIKILSQKLGFDVMRKSVPAPASSSAASPSSVQ